MHSSLQANAQKYAWKKANYNTGSTIHHFDNINELFFDTGLLLCEALEEDGICSDSTAVRNLFVLYLSFKYSQTSIPRTSVPKSNFQYLNVILISRQNSI